MIGIPILVVSFFVFLMESWVLCRNGRYHSRLGLTGCEVARHILDACGATQVTVDLLAAGGGPYGVGLKQLYLEETVYRGKTLGDLACAAREAAMKVEGDAALVPLEVKKQIAALCRIFVLVAWGALVVGRLYAGLASVGSYALFTFVGVFLLSVFGLPMEFEASVRAYALLKDSRYFEIDELARLRRLLYMQRVASLGQFFRVPVEVGLGLMKGRDRGA